MITTNIVNFNEEYTNIKDNLQSQYLKQIQSLKDKKQKGKNNLLAFLCVLLDILFAIVLWLFLHKLIILYVLLVIVFSFILAICFVTNCDMQPNKKVLELSSRYAVLEKNKDSLTAVTELFKEYKAESLEETLAEKQVKDLQLLQQLDKEPVNEFYINGAKLRLNNVVFEDYVFSDSTNLAPKLQDIVEITDSCKDIFVNFSGSMLEFYVGVKKCH